MLHVWLYKCNLLSVFTVAFICHLWLDNHLGCSCLVKTNSSLSSFQSIALHLARRCLLSLFGHLQASLLLGILATAGPWGQREQSDEQGFRQPVSMNSTNDILRPALGRSTLLGVNQGLYSFGEGGVGIFRMGKGHWQNAKGLRCLSSIGKHSRNLSVS